MSKKVVELRSDFQYPRWSVFSNDIARDLCYQGFPVWWRNWDILVDILTVFALANSVIFCLEMD